MKSSVANPILVDGPAGSRRNRKPMTEETIVFFDGICGLCNKSVDFLLREDREGKLRFSPLQGETFRPLGKENPELASVDAIVVLHRDASGERLFTSSDAVLFALTQLPQFSWLAKAGYTIPKFVREPIYRFIAAIRYRVWGKRETCRLPTLEERAKFLP
jgi:predicted DCC family thiol-disulfide oxidoreductase YuxK